MLPFPSGGPASGGPASVSAWSIQKIIKVLSNLWNELFPLTLNVL